MNTAEVDSSSTINGFAGSENSIGDSKTHSFSLLSPERSLKFDLLLHLITNLAKPIVLCGPDGIGKTTILRQVSAHGSEDWTVCYFESTSKTTFDSILQRLGESAAFANKQDSSNQIKQMKENGRSLVLLLDDAGLLMPGLLKALCEFAQSNSAVRLVFSMRPDHLHIKTATDFGLDDCHIVDLPPLTEQQCLDFLLDLPANTRQDLSIEAVTPALAQRAYKESHGVPGEAIKYFLPKDRKTDKAVENTKFYWVSVGVVSVVSIVATSIILKVFFKDEPILRSAGTDSSKQEQTLDRHRPTAERNGNGRDKSNTETSLARVDSVTKFVKLDTNTQVLTDKTDEPESLQGQTKLVGTIERYEPPTDQEIPSENPVGTDVRSDNPAQINDPIPSVFAKPASTVSESPKLGDLDSIIEADNIAKIQPENIPRQNQASLIDFVIPGIQGSDWLLAQNPRHWTLQIIVVNRLNLLRSFAADHPDLSLLASFGVKVEDETVFRVFYGAFSTLKEAKLANEDLPESLRQSWPRKFKLIHEEISVIQSSSSGI